MSGHQGLPLSFKQWLIPRTWQSFIGHINKTIYLKRLFYLVSIHDIYEVSKAINHNKNDSKKTCSNEKTHEPSRCTDKFPDVINKEFFFFDETWGFNIQIKGCRPISLPCWIRIRFLFELKVSIISVTEILRWLLMFTILPNFTFWCTFCHIE